MGLIPGTVPLLVALICQLLIGLNINQVRASLSIANANGNFNRFATGTNHLSQTPTSSPFVSAAASAAAAAALGAIDNAIGSTLAGGSNQINQINNNNNNNNNGLSVSNKVALPASQVVEKTATTTTTTTTTTTSSSTNGQQNNVKIGQQVVGSTTPTPLVVSSIKLDSQDLNNLVKIHKHSNKKINVSDRLHKFDLFVDPICEQINKLTEKQINKVHLQLKQFSQLVSGFEGLPSRLLPVEELHLRTSTS